MDKKVAAWNKVYSGTKIDIVRKGGSAQDFVEFFKKVRNYPNLKKKVVLVVNFISKREFRDRLEKLREGESFRERNQVIQVLWFISSLLSGCNEAGVEVYVFCKP